MASKLPHFGFRTTRTNLEKLSYIAERNGRSANKELEQLLIALIAQYEKEHGVIPLDFLENQQ